MLSPPVTDLVEQELRAVNESGQHLQQLQGELTQNLSSLQEQINRTLQSCGHPCSQVSVSGLAPEANFSMVRRAHGGLTGAQGCGVPGGWMGAWVTGWHGGLGVVQSGAGLHGELDGCMGLGGLKPP